MRKRFLSVLLSLTVALSLTVTPSLAVEPATVTVETVVEAVEAGGEVTLDVSIADNPGFTNFEWNIVYDNARLELKSINTYDADENDYIKRAIVVENINKNDTGKGYITCARETATTMSGTLFTLTFQVKADAEPGAASVSITEDLFRNEAAKVAVNATYVAGSVIVKETTTGGSTTGGSTTGGSTTGGSTTGGSTTGGSTTGGSTTGGSTTGGSTTGGSTTGGSTTGGTTTGGSTTGGSTTGGSTTGGSTTGGSTTGGSTTGGSTTGGSTTGGSTTGGSTTGGSTTGGSTTGGSTTGGTTTGGSTTEEPHEHTFSTEWSMDATYHWHAATCEHTAEVADKAAHTWNDGTVTTEPTYSAPGVKTYTCTVCDQVKTEEVAQLTRPSTGGSGSSSSSSSDSTVTPGKPSNSPTVSTDTSTNADGSVTTVETKKDGTVVETTKQSDGSVVKVETQKDGTVITSEIQPDGSSTTVSTKTDVKTDSKGNTTTTTVNVTKTTTADGKTTSVETVTQTVETKTGEVTSVTTAKSSNGSSSVTRMDADGKVETEAKISATAVADAVKGKDSVAVPMPPVVAGTDAGSAPVVRISLAGSAKSVKVEIPVVDVTPGTVAVIVNADGTEQIVSTSKVTENGVALTMDGSATVKIIDNSKSFPDVPETNVFYNEIAFLSAREMMIGKRNGEFDLRGIMTLDQAANVAARIIGAVDVKDFSAGVAWGKENGLKTGNVAATRGDVLMALYKAAGSPVVEDTAVLNKFTDAASIPDELTAAAAWAAQNGILKGNTDGTTGLGSSVTRGQGCALAARTMGTLG